MELIKSRQDKLTVYKYVNDLFEETQATKEGAYIEIVIEQPDQPIRKHTIHQRTDNLDIEANENDKNTYGIEDPVFRHRLLLLIKLQENYDLLIETASIKFLDFVSEFEGQDDVQIRVVRKNMPVRFLPRVELEPEAEADSDDDEDSEHESSEEETDSSSEEEDDDDDEGLHELLMLFESDSGLESETDVDPEENVHIYSDPESGIE